MVNEKRKRLCSTKKSNEKMTESDKLHSKKPKGKDKPASSQKKSASTSKSTANSTIGSVKQTNGLQEENDDFFKSCGKSNRTNSVNVFNQLQRGFCKQSTLHQLAEQVYLKRLRWYHIYMEVGLLDLRVTSMQWHPHNPAMLVTGGKAGTLTLYGSNNWPSADSPSAFMGAGPGCTIEAIRFNTKRSGIEVCTASVDGTVSTYSFHNLKRETLVQSSNSYQIWFCSVDVHEDGKSVYGGDNQGAVALHHLDSNKTDYQCEKLKLHTAKIRHLEFNRRDSNLMVTASLDKTVKLWDIRMLNGKNSFIHCIKQESTNVHSAVFSLTDGCRLLTTDLHNQLCVYKAPLWVLEHKIPHPHRTFQHLTQIRATWHPLADMFVVGRYPDPKLPTYTKDELRSVDIFSAESGKLCHQLFDSSRLITSLAQFNSSASTLATSSGRTVNLWETTKVPTCGKGFVRSFTEYC